ncbi:hypothetical protein HY631_02115 [Candidatus Uhrbacteria bacterium]|nr:hypothetical protein [Candidatus Uhrbacteria bacterium]
MINQHTASATLRAVRRLTKAYGKEVKNQTRQLSQEVDAILIEVAQERLKKKDV